MLLREAMECLLSDDVETGKAVLCGYINATVGIFQAGSGRASLTQKPDANAEFRRKPQHPQSIRNPRVPSRWKVPSARARGSSVASCDRNEKIARLRRYSRKLKVYIIPLDARLREAKAPGGKNPYSPGARSAGSVIL